MPSPSTAELPRPKSWDELEDIVADVLQPLWEAPHITRHGRSGQRQHGVDIYGDVKVLDRKLGVAQVRNRLTDEVKTDDVDGPLAEIDDEFEPAPALFVLCTSARRDVAIQKHVRIVSAARKANGLCAAEIMFWEDICSELTKHPSLVRKHYPEWGRIEGVGVEADVLRREHAQAIARLNTLQNRRFDVLGQIQALTFDAHTAFLLLVSDMKYVHVRDGEDTGVAAKRHHANLKSSAGEAFNKLVQYANHNGIWLPEQVARRVQEVIALFKEAYFKYTAYDFASHRDLQPASRERKWANEDEAQSMVQVRLTSLLCVLESEMRAVIELGA